eukprot:scpid69689/ scgid13986/ 
MECVVVASDGTSNTKERHFEDESRAKRCRHETSMNDLEPGIHHHYVTIRIWDVYDYGLRVGTSYHVTSWPKSVQIDACTNRVMVIMSSRVKKCGTVFRNEGSLVQLEKVSVRLVGACLRLGPARMELLRSFLTGLYVCGWKGKRRHSHSMESSEKYPALNDADVQIIELLLAVSVHASILVSNAVMLDLVELRKNS